MPREHPRKATRWLILTALPAVIILAAGFSAGRAASAAASRARLPSVDRPLDIRGNPLTQVAESPPVEFQNPRFEHIGIQDGLSTSIVNVIAQDQQGFIWIGTDGGLNRFDGYQVSEFAYAPSYTFNLSSITVTSFFADSQGYLWIGSDAGLNRYNPQSGLNTQFRYVQDDISTLSSDRVNVIYEDRSGAIWVGTDYGLNRFDRGTETFTRYLPVNIISDLVEDQEGLLWIASSFGLISWDPVAERFSMYTPEEGNPDSLTSSFVTALQKDADDNLWLGTSQGINYFDRAEAKFRAYQHDPRDPSSLSDNLITDLLLDSEGRIWAGTLNGLNLLLPGAEGFLHYQRDPADPSSLSDDLVSNLFEDRSGVIWIGTISGGVNKYSRYNNRFQVYPPLGNSAAVEANPEQSSLRESLHGALITAVLPDRRGDLWIGTILEGLYRLDSATGTIQQFKRDPQNPASLNSDVVHSLFEDRSGTLWVGTDSGLSQYNPGDQSFEIFPTFTGDRVDAMAQDAAGDFWVGASGDLFRLFSGADGELLSEKSSLQLSTDARAGVISLLVDSKDTLWVGTDQGLFARYSGQDTFSHYAHEPDNDSSLSSDLVYTIFEDRQGVIWVGTVGGGLNSFDRSAARFNRYGEQGFVTGSWIACLQNDADDNLWVGTNRGLAKFDPQSGAYHNFDTLDGLQEGEFYSCAGGDDGMLYFGGLKGLNIFHPLAISENEQPPQVVITSFNLFNQVADTNLEEGQQVVLGYRENFISFDYAALDYNAPSKNQYAYMLEGLDEDWIYVGSRRHAEYPDLEPGSYTFRVRASNNDGFWNETGTALKIRIQPPFWQLPWFQLLLVMAILASIYGGYQLRVRSLKAQSQELAQQVAQRTHDLTERTREAERRQAELEALYRADAELYRYLHLDHVFHALVDAAVDILEADKGDLMVWDQKHENLVVRAAVGFDPQTLKYMVFAPGEGVTGEVAVTGQPVILEHAGIDPRPNKKILAAEGIQAFMQVPIKIGGEVFGVFSANYTRPHTFTEQEQRLLIALAQRAALAIENARLYEQAQELAALEERNRLARDLHDSVTQTLFGASMFADTAEHQLQADQIEQAKETLHKLRTTTRDALGEMRLLIYELRPPILEKEGLAAALEARLETVEQRAGLQTELHLDYHQRLSMEVEQQLFSIAIEALNNSLKHAHAQKISVSLVNKGGSLTLQIADDGLGFDTQLARESGGMGIRNMQERADQLGAAITLDSQPGKGTEIRLVLENSL